MPVKLAGVCRHETDPLTGRADTMRHGEEDVRLLKAANLNYIRTSHYPPTLELVDAADKFGMYLEVEAPFCWVAAGRRPGPASRGPGADLGDDRFLPHASQRAFWSLANESHFNRCFEISHDLVRQLDPTRPTTFNNPDPKRVCEIANLHYPPMPYDDQIKDDPRPIILGEYFFPVCHEQTDVAINPGLRELFGFGHSDPDSAWGRQCAESFSKPFLKPGRRRARGATSSDSRRVTGGAIWAALDDAFYFPDGTHAGYAWHHGFWGILDAWRRPKPEWWLTKLIFSPVWFPCAGSTTRRASPRFAFRSRTVSRSPTSASWPSPGSWGRSEGDVRPRVPPRSRAKSSCPFPPGTPEGEKLILKRA